MLIITMRFPGNHNCTKDFSCPTQCGTEEVLRQRQSTFGSRGFLALGFA
jgi:hypothetical protein